MTTIYHSSTEIRDALDELTRRLDDAEKLLDDKLEKSYAGHPGFWPAQPPQSEANEI